MLDVLTEASLLTREQRAEARKRLAASGGWGVALTADEMKEVGAESNWTLNATLAGALRDRAARRARPGPRWDEIVAFFQAVCEARPELTGVWVQRAMDAAVQAFPAVPAGALAEALLVTAWDIDESTRVTSDRCFQAIVREVKALPWFLKTRGYDPVLGALNLILSAFQDQPDQLRFTLFCRIIGRLPLEEQNRAWDTFVR